MEDVGLREDSREGEGLELGGEGEGGVRFFSRIWWLDSRIHLFDATDLDF